MLMLLVFVSSFSCSSLCCPQPDFSVFQGAEADFPEILSPVKKLYSSLKIENILSVVC